MLLSLPHSQAWFSKERSVHGLAKGRVTLRHSCGVSGIKNVAHEAGKFNPDDASNLNPKELLSCTFHFSRVTRGLHVIGCLRSQVATEAAKVLMAFFGQRLARR